MSNTGPSPSSPSLDQPFQSFCMGGYEGADHAALGIRTVRESIGWRLAEPPRRRYDLERAPRIARAARRHGIQVLWSLMHDGTPPDIDLFDAALIERFAAYAAALADRPAPRHDVAPVYTPINEISFLSWVGQR